MFRIWRMLKHPRSPSHPYHQLNMGRVQQYSLIIPKAAVPAWLARGWIEVPHFRNYHYAPGPTETVVLGRPPTLSEVGIDTVIGRRIIKYSTSLGTYGMGGPGFLGLLLEDESAPTTEHDGRDALVFAVTVAGEYTLINNRIVNCHPRYYHLYHPWVSFYADEDIENWDNLSPVLLGSTIHTVTLEDDCCTITVTNHPHIHIIEFVKNDVRLAPLSVGGPRTDAFTTGEIGQYLLIQKEHAVLHVN